MNAHRIDLLTLQEIVMARALPKPMPALAALVAGADVLTRPSGDVPAVRRPDGRYFERSPVGPDDCSDLTNELARRMFAQMQFGRSSPLRQPHFIRRDKAETLVQGPAIIRGMKDDAPDAACGEAVEQRTHQCVGDAAPPPGGFDIDIENNRF